MTQVITPEVGSRESNYTIANLRKDYPKTCKAIFGVFTLVSIVALSTSQITHFQKNLQNSIERIDGNNSCPNSYALSEKIRVNVCLTKQNDVVVDIRQFLNKKSTIKGIALTMHEYFLLGQLYDSIHTDVKHLHDGI